MTGSTLLARRVGGCEGWVVRWHRRSISPVPLAYLSSSKLSFSGPPPDDPSLNTCERTRGPPDVNSPRSSPLQTWRWKQRKGAVGGGRWVPRPRPRRAHGGRGGHAREARRDGLTTRGCGAARRLEGLGVGCGCGGSAVFTSRVNTWPSTVLTTNASGGLAALSTPAATAVDCGGREMERGTRGRLG